MPVPPLSEEIKQQTIKAYEQSGGNKQKAADLLGIPVSTFKCRYTVATKHESVSSLDRFIPDGQKLRGVSTLYNKDGQSVSQWVKTSPDTERQIEIVKEATEAMRANIPKEKPTIYKKNAIDDLASMYMVTDYHIGMMAQAGECGEDWNTDKAVKFLVDWFATAISFAPDSKTAIFAQGGDFLHYDSMDAVTPTSRHLMDTDARYSKIVNVTILALRKIISMLLEKHEHVHIIMVEGNHDLASSIWLRAMLADKYLNEPRVTVDNTDSPYYCYEHGKTALFFHHGHKKKMTEVSKVFAGMFRAVFGRTKYAYAHMGHLHHWAGKEDSLMIVEQHPTLAVKDAHAARGGYLANRGACVITYSRECGETSRVRIPPEMVKA